MTTPSPHPHWHNHTFRAMGCQMTIWLELDEAAQAEDLLYQSERLFAAAEKRLTRFRDDSELSQLNIRSGEWVAVSNVLWQVVQQALWLADETHGLFDPTMLKAVEGAGYDRSFDLMHRRSTPPLFAESGFGHWSLVEMDAARHAIRLPEGVGLDLGGIGKGYTAQQVVSYLKHWGPCLVDASGDICAGDAPRGYPGWPVSIMSPWAGQGVPRDDLLSLWLANGTLATSGIDYRWWLQDGRVNHHLIDPRTGLPAQTDARTVSVLSASALRAEAWAKAALIAGVAEGLLHLVKQELAGAFVTATGELKLTKAMLPFAAAT